MEDLTRKSIEQLTQSELFQRVSDICATVNVSTSTNELLEVSLKQTLELFGAQRGSIFILKDNGKDLILKSSQGLEVNEEQDIVKRLGEGVVGRVAETKKPIFVDDIGKDERFKDCRSPKSYQTPSFICAPLLIKDKLIGVINISEKKSGSRFTPNELQLLDFLSSQIALNYRRIQLYNKFKSIVKETQNLKDELGKSSQEAHHLKKQVVLHERLASLGKLAGGIAHEFNNPLDGVMRYTNLCLEHAQDNEVLRGYLLEVKNGLNRMANIVKSLLACSRESTSSTQKIDVNQSIEQIIKTLQGDIQHKNIKIETVLKSPVNEITNLGLDLVISNLLRNSIDAIDKDGFIQVQTNLEDGHLIIRIKDSGCGIDQEKVESIFEPFYTTKDIDKGCGLGLTIVSEIVKAYNGQINVESATGLGSEFSISIPAEFNG